MPAAAITWAISPPIVPAPTTAALKRTCVDRSGRSAARAARSTGASALALDREAVERARAARRAIARRTKSQSSTRGLQLLELVVELERRRRRGANRSALDAGHLRRPRPRRPGPCAASTHVTRSTTRPRPPGCESQIERAVARPLGVQRHDGAEAVHERRPAGEVVPELLHREDSTTAGSIATRARTRVMRRSSTRAARPRSRRRPRPAAARARRRGGRTRPRRRAVSR